MIKVAQLIANRLVLTLTVTEGMTFQQDLGADSLDVVKLVMELEDEFGIQISDEDAENITTIGDAVNYVTEHQAIFQRDGRFFYHPFLLSKEIKFS